MTPHHFRECLAALHWSQRALADILGLSDTTVRRWASGKQDIPQAVSSWLERISGPLAQMPLPSGWKTQPDCHVKTSEEI